MVHPSGVPFLLFFNIVGWQTPPFAGLVIFAFFLPLANRLGVPGGW